MIVEACRIMSNYVERKRLEMSMPARIYKIYFSPTKTTKRVVSIFASAVAAAVAGSSAASAAGALAAAVASGSNSAVAGSPQIFDYDFTKPSAREGFPVLNSDDLVIFGMPTYAGRLPNLIVPYLKTFVQGNGAMVIPVVTFGNRAFDNSLIELRDILQEKGFLAVAAAACACEHSFSETLGGGRPDEADAKEISEFAMRVAEILEDLGDLEGRDSGLEKAGRSDLEICVPVPGIDAQHNYGGYYQPQDRHGKPIDIRKVKPLTDKDKCGQCGFCAEICPMGAIDRNDASLVPGKCIKCGACTKLCPSKAKYYDDVGYLYHKSELEEVYARRANNQFFAI